MIIPASVTDSITAAGIDVSNDWLSATAPVWNADYSAILTQPISIAVTPLADMRFLSVTTATITIRISSAPLSLVSWSGIATLVADDTTGGGSPIYPVHNSFTGRDVPDTHPMAAITDLVETLAAIGGTIVEVANYAALPAVGSPSVTYVTLDDGRTYRWGGTVYVEIGSSLVLGETSTTAYRGDRGKTAYDHSQIMSGNPHGVDLTMIGAIGGGGTAGKLPIFTAGGVTIGDSILESDGSTLLVRSSAPGLTTFNYLAAAGMRRWSWENGGGSAYLTFYNDAGTVSGTPAIVVDRSGNSASQITFTSTNIYLSPLSAGGIVKASASTGRVGIALAADFPALNQSTTGNAATATKWATARNLTIGSSTQALDGTSDKTFTLAAIGAQAALSGGTANAVTKWTGTGSLGNSQITDNGTDVGFAGMKSRVYSASYGAMYGDGVATPSAANFGLILGRGGVDAYLNGTTKSALSVNNGEVVTATSGGATITGVLTVGDMNLRQIAGSTAAAGIYGASVASPSGTNYSLWIAENGGAAYLNGSATASLAVGDQERVRATTTGVEFPLLTGATTRLATINAAGQLGAATTFPLVGVTNGSSATSGIVGEILSASASGTTFSGTSAGVSLVSLSLPAGSWLVWSSSQITNGQAPSSLTVYLSYSSTGTTFINNNSSFALGSPVAFTGISCATAPTPINQSTTATVYLIGAEQTTGTAAVNNGATIYAQRIR